ncbi:RhoGAP-domain-containing protein [Fomitiporia mediterranea MF3/22]|uniref:RhoGAP-domain-containing protein n=1 Tax=Fomitiporia mediterranea (strain MF3/22) TaxID=694068 RepID=UPI0004407642|nr:RhoGAP-domain-containing protein [Fomitiporia mediterranea MF3/22]EJD07549.1 RhoGAP-domain-containing protein [Fomitiporia mediterranea MF3/22]
MDPAVAARLAASPSANTSRSHPGSSPSTMRLVHSGSATGLNGEDVITNSAVTVEQALAAHASTPDPVRAALDSVLQERNTLSAQNSQLWNHLKKQRNNYQLAVGDVKRIRAERDALRAKLAKYEHPSGGEHFDDKRQRPSTSNSPAESNVDTKGVASPESGHHHYPIPKSKVSRHHSEDRPVFVPLTQPDMTGPSRKRSASRDQHTQSSSSSSHMNARETSKGHHRERSNTHPEFTTPTSINGSEPPTSPSSPIEVHYSSGHERDGNGSTSRNPQHSTSPPPLVIPTRSESLPSGSSTSMSDASPSHRVVVNGEVKVVEDPLSTAKPSVSKVFIPAVSPPTDHPPENTVPTNQPPDSRVFTSDGKGGSAATSSSSVNLTPNYLTAGSARKASRESRISLPDEAKHYYANLADSPLASPHVGGPTDGWNYTKRPTNGESSLAQVPEEGDSRGNESASPRPFLELDTTDDSESEHRASGDARTRETDSELDPEGAEGNEYRYIPNRAESPAHSESGQVPKARGAKTTADQFPLPPSTYNIPPPQSPTQLQSANGVGGGKTATSIASGSSLMSSSNTLALDVGSRRTHDKIDSFILPTSQPAATFRQMPLLDTDLKTSTVEVVGSHIRANDKGKEVLSFVIAIHVVGKESWQIEKFYSDVLALDSRLRTRCSRATLKKLEPLPDNKLFKDHAPAKVDQRKRMLQAYLQSVMKLPIKDKNEIIVFFSSDVVRERSPVTRSGYKEGYLTKRGKNFGGWKTRYFVLQGPVLEYYENRGGAHLGSIQIAGAQIGRQQRAGGKGDLDDENEFRHAFLIIEQKRGPAGQNTRHVLCAESDQERDAWVEVLVRYVMGSYNEDEKSTVSSTSPVTNSVQNGIIQPRTSMSSLNHNDSTPTTRRVVSKDQIQKSNVMPIPISQLAVDGSTAKFFQSFGPASPTKSPADKGSVSSIPFLDSSGKSSLDRVSAEDSQQSSSLPITSSLSEATPTLASIGERSISELGHYPDLQTTDKHAMSADPMRPQDRTRASYYPTLAPVAPSPTDRPSSPEKGSPAAASPSQPKDDVGRLSKISGPLNGVPIPAGYKFGSKEPVPDQQPSSDRERKARSRAFWRWTSANDKAANAPTFQPRAVFGVPLEDSLAVSQIANLPAIVFRSIQYLEANKADQEEGIYRLSGSSAVIKNLKDRFNAEGDVDLLTSDVRDPHAIAGLLKTFLRELPSSLLTRELHMRFLAVMDFVDTQERIRELQELVSQLPLANYSLLRALTAHLILIVQNSNINKMTMRNVGIVFSPTLGVPAGVFSLMLGEFNRVFNVNGEGSDSSVDEEDTTKPAPQRLSGGLSRRNSKRYSDAAADQLLGLSGRTLPTTTEDQSDDGDDLSVHDQDESDTTTEADAETEGSVRVGSPAIQYQEQVHPPPEESEVATPNKSHASFVAASRGLNLNLTGSTTKADRRRSRIPQGLPSSPRPSGAGSPLHTPTFGTQSDSSPQLVPR